MLDYKIHSGKVSILTPQYTTLIGITSKLQRVLRVYIRCAWGKEIRCKTFRKVNKNSRWNELRGESEYLPFFACQLLWLFLFSYAYFMFSSNSLSPFLTQLLIILSSAVFQAKDLSLILRHQFFFVSHNWARIRLLPIIEWGLKSLKLKIQSPICELCTVFEKKFYQTNTLLRFCLSISQGGDKLRVNRLVENKHWWIICTFR